MHTPSLPIAASSPPSSLALGAVERARTSWPLDAAPPGAALASRDASAPEAHGPDAPARRSGLAADTVTLSIVLLVRNERATVRATVARLLASDVEPRPREIVIVDRGSDDGTAEVVAEVVAELAAALAAGTTDRKGRPGVKAMALAGGARNAGEAVDRGLRASTSDFVILQDAALDYDAGDYSRMLAPLLDGKADVVYGSRFLGAPGGRRVWHFWSWVAQRMQTLWANAFTGVNLTDVGTGAKAFARGLIDRLELASASAAALDAEIVCKVTRLRARVWEVPISYGGGAPHHGPQVRLSHVVRTMVAVLRYWRWEAPRGDVGAITLRRMARLQPYNRWLHDRFDGYLGERILEVGSGVGNQTCYFADRERVIASDIEPHYVRELSGAFGHRTNVRIASFRFPLSQEDRADLTRERVDSIVCTNVLEHIEDDRGTLADFASVLRPGGRLVLLVPAHPALHGTLDVALHHYRRYDKEALRALVTEAGFEIDTLHHLNRPGAAGWWLNSRVLKRRVLPGGQLRAFRWIMPLLALETRRAPSFGLSLLVLARKRGA